MQNFEHIPVLKDQAIKILLTKKDGVYVDCTLGRAGYSLEILNKIDKKGKLFSIDQDIEAINYANQIAKNYANWEIINANFANLKAILAIKNCVKVDGIVFDLGISSPQIDDEYRGFSYRYDSDLDMRMDLKNELRASDVVNNFNFEELFEILKNYGQEKFAYSIAKNIVSSREKKPIKTTFELVQIIKNSLPQNVKKQKKHPAKKTFQALRIYVNDELECLKKGINQGLEMLNPNGVMVIVSFHSLEENIIKKIFKEKTVSDIDEINKKLPFNLENKKEYVLIKKRPVKPSQDEIDMNKRSHSAKLWAIAKKQGVINE